MGEIFTYGSVGGALGNQCFYPETSNVEYGMGKTEVGGRRSEIGGQRNKRRYKVSLGKKGIGCVNLGE